MDREQEEGRGDGDSDSRHRARGQEHPGGRARAVVGGPAGGWQPGGSGSGSMDFSRVHAGSWSGPCAPQGGCSSSHTGAQPRWGSQEPALGEEVAPGGTPRGLLPVQTRAGGSWQLLQAVGTSMVTLALSDRPLLLRASLSWPRRASVSRQ